ncbi:MAG: Gfo/Idh/MocA family oxidoreductase [Actinomycetota bacterium]|nr:Gfo/Idh/MocA family oxidoreductase [Actinomycetota bacterium]
MSDVRWGVLGAGWLVNQATGAALHNAAGARFAAAAASDLGRARATGAERAFDAYAAVVEDPAIDAVYICLNNDAHLPWIDACIEAGKHVLCEKPLVMTAGEAEAAFARAEAAGVLLVEAVWTRWHPRMRRIVQLATDGSLGEVTSYLGTFTFDGVTEGNYRLEASRGGGALYDVGIYPLHGLFACLPTVERLAVVDVDRTLGGVDVDLTTKATLGWGSGSRATVIGSFAMPASQRLTLHGTAGQIRVEDDEAWASWRKATDVWVDGHAESFPEVDAYQVMFEDVSAAIRGEGGWVLPPRDSIRVARAVDSLRA